jgi:hypothetical protein
MANAGTLRVRLAGFYDEDPAIRVMLGSDNWPAGQPTFASRIANVMTIVIHETSGFPARNRVEDFIGCYTVPQHERRGFGPQFFISSDGTVARLIDIDPQLLTWHATFLNLQAVGIENGHRDSQAPAANAQGQVLERWRPLSPDPDDVPGQKFFVFDHRFDNPNEVLFCWFPTARFDGPKGATTMTADGMQGMLFTEFQYRSLAALARYLAEQCLAPRNFPLLPWATREGNFDNPANGASPSLRLIALADENFSAILNELAALGFTEPMFNESNLADFRGHYHSAIRQQNTLVIRRFGLNQNNKQINLAWLDQFAAYRGFHGHGFAGSVHRDNQHNTDFDDHTTCPGPLFDWHRFAREVWDWWWYPFDFNATFTTTAVPIREYRQAGPDTKLVEYFFENTPSDGRADPYIARSSPPDGPPGGIFGEHSSPSTFRLEQGTPVYAMANGELVAARLLPPTAAVSMSFVLVRHDVYHVNDLTGAAAQGRIDYDQEPATVYSLYMHLGQTDQMSFAEVVPNNPDWLNRVLIRKKECDLAVDHVDVLEAIPFAHYTQPPPLTAHRPTSLELLAIDRLRLGEFLNSLRSGGVALAPGRLPGQSAGATPVNVVLGDFLGTAGTIRVNNQVPMSGMCVEIFSPVLIDPLFFTEVNDKTSFDVPPLVLHPAVQYISEWARVPKPDERAAMQAIGVNPDLVTWWVSGILAQLWNVTLPADAVLPADARVYHYRPLDFVRWINDVTWASEWSKYRVKDASGNALPRPNKPRSRRVT